MKRATAIVLATIVVLSTIALPLGAAATTSAQTAGPSGMVALGSDQISEDLPDGTDAPLRASDLEGAVYASDHADTLEVVVTTPDRAADYLDEDGSNVIAEDDEVAIVLRDDEVHDGREVAVEIGVFEESLGYVPSIAFGTHESGEEWTSAITREGTVASFEVPRFSDNAVSFTGGISLSGDAAADGTNYEYELENLDGVDDYSINVTGVNNTNQFSEKEILSDGGSIPVAIGGNSDAQNVAIVLEGKSSTTASSMSPSVSTYVDGAGVQDSSDTPKSDETIDTVFTASKSETYTLGFDYTMDAESGSFDGYSGTTYLYYRIYDDSAGSWSSYTQLKSMYTQNGDNYDSGTVTVTESLDAGDKVGVKTSATLDSSPTDDASHYYESEFTGGSASYSVDTGSVDGYFSGYSFSSPALSPGETWVKEFGTLTPGDKSLSVSTSSGGGVITNISGIEISKTTDPVVEVNGHTTNYDGTLADGETTSLATNEAWLENGTNTVTVSTNSPASGPESLVGFDYAHDASGATKSVDVEATSWTEQFNVSNTYPSAVENARATLTFDEDVAEIRSAEYRVDGGEWQSADSTDLNGTDLEVQLGNVDADTTVTVRATGHKVRSYDGDVSILEPTVEGDELATEVEISELRPDTLFGLRVDGTSLGDRVHYASDESWTGAGAYAEISSSGTQILRAPDANNGSTMTVSSAPLSVSSSNGGIEVDVQDADEPRFSLRKGNTTGADRVEVTFYDTLDGERYVLWSETEEREVDAQRANSPVTFVTNGDSETYTIRQMDAGSNPDGPAGPTGVQDTIPLVVAFGGVGVVLVGTTLVGRRFDVGGELLPVTATTLAVIAVHVLSPGRSPVVRLLELGATTEIGAIVAAPLLLLALWQLDRRTAGNIPTPVYILLGILSGVYALETLSPGVVLGGLREGISTMGPLLVAAGVIGIAWFLRSWIRAQREEATTPDTQITLEGIRGGDD